MELFNEVIDWLIVVLPASIGASSVGHFINESKYPRTKVDIILAIGLSTFISFACLQIILLFMGFEETEIIDQFGLGLWIAYFISNSIFVWYKNKASRPSDSDE